MKVSELITILKDYNQDECVYLSDKSGCVYEARRTAIHCINESDAENLIINRKGIVIE